MGQVRMNVAVLLNSSFTKCKQLSDTNIYSYLETSGGQSSNLYWNVVHFFNTRVNYTSVAS
jgi:hypothetical protein